MLLVLSILAIVLLTLGIPIWLVFLVSSMVVLFFFTNVSLMVVTSTLFGALDNLVLMAVPGFIFAGVIMGRGGMTQRLVTWIHSLVGPIPAGIPITTIAAAEVFGAMSGSSAASTAALGKILYPALRGHGYSERFSLGLICSCGCIATIIPPSISTILYASVTGAPLGKLFLAGFIPGIILGVMVSFYALYVFYREKHKREKHWNWAEIWRTTKLATSAMLLPVIIFAGIYGGFTTPTEAAALASAYAVVIACFVYREMNSKDFWEVTAESAMLTSKIFLITASAGLFSWVLSISQAPQDLVKFIGASDVSPWVILLMINLLLILAGMFIDPASIMLVLGPILWPIAKVIGVDIVHFGIIMTINCAIGMFSPPFGLNIFVCAAIFRVSTGLIAISIVPFFVIYLFGLILATYIPSLSPWLPSHVLAR
jgi:C4-dicarboxylate transporter DctM subunit